MSPFDELPCPVLVTDRAGNMQTVNRQLLTLVGGTQASRAGVSMEQLFPMASRVFLQTHVWPMVLREGRVREIRLQMLDESGQQVPVFVNGERHSADGTDRFT